AAVDHGAVPDGDARTEDRGQALVLVHRDVVLEVGVVTDLDRRRVAAHHGVEPHAGARPERDLAHHHGAGGDEGGGVEPEPRRPVVMAAVHANLALSPTNGLCMRSSPIVVSGPWPGSTRSVSPRTNRR